MLNALAPVLAFTILLTLAFNMQKEAEDTSLPDSIAWNASITAEGMVRDFVETYLHVNADPANYAVATDLDYTPPQAFRVMADWQGQAWSNGENWYVALWNGPDDDVYDEEAMMRGIMSASKDFSKIPGKPWTSGYFSSDAGNRIGQHEVGGSGLRIPEGSYVLLRIMPIS